MTVRRPLPVSLLAEFALDKTLTLEKVLIVKAFA
jgi:hypothetical protein